MNSRFSDQSEFTKFSDRVINPIRTRFSLQNALVPKNDPCTKFQLNWTKTGTRTVNGSILGLLLTKFKDDVILTSQLGISSSILFPMLDFIHF